jgi:hypothetical protein
MHRVRLSSLFLALMTLTQLNAQMHYDPSPAAVVELADGKLQGAEPFPGVHAFLGIHFVAGSVMPEVANTLGGASCTELNSSDLPGSR